MAYPKCAVLLVVLCRLSLAQFFGPDEQPAPAEQPQAKVAPQLGCAAALICVEEQYCTMTGIISETPVRLTEAQLLRRVPMVDCRNPENGVVGKCCRDPNYEDPWPNGGSLPPNYKGGFDQNGFPLVYNMNYTSTPRPVTPRPSQPLGQRLPSLPLQPGFPRPGAPQFQRPGAPQPGLPKPVFPQQNVPNFIGQGSNVNPAEEYPYGQDKENVGQDILSTNQALPADIYKLQRPGQQPKPFAQGQNYPQNIQSIQQGRPFGSNDNSNVPTKLASQPNLPSPTQQPSYSSPSPSFQPQTQRPFYGSSLSPSIPTQTKQPYSPSISPNLPTQTKQPYSPSISPNLPTQTEQPYYPSASPSVPTQTKQPYYPSSTPSIPTQTLKPYYPSASPSIPTQTEQPYYPSALPNIPSQTKQPSYPSGSLNVLTQTEKPYYPSASPSIPTQTKQPSYPSGSLSILSPTEQPYSPSASPNFPSQTKQPSYPSGSLNVLTQTEKPYYPSASPSIPTQTKQPYYPSGSLSSSPQSPKSPSPSPFGPGQKLENDFGEGYDYTPPFIQPHTPGAQCGIINKVQSKYDKLYGSNVPFGEIPWQAMVLSASMKKPVCSGVIVAPNAVVTAANCVYGRPLSDVSVKSGEWKLGYELKHEEPLPFEIVPAQRIEIHPNYQPGVAGNDMAVIILQKSFKLDLHVDTLCLGEQPRMITPQRKCISTGWGKMAVADHVAGAHLSKIQVNLMDENECRNRLRGATTQLGLDESLMCARPANKNNNMCEVDVGGPLACDRGDGYYELIGVYSQDTGCYPVNQVATFSMIDYPWIHSVLGGRPVSPLATKFEYEGPAPYLGQPSNQPRPFQAPSQLHYHQPGVPCDCREGSVPAGLHQYLPPQ